MQLLIPQIEIRKTQMRRKQETAEKRSLFFSFYIAVDRIRMIYSDCKATNHFNFDFQQGIQFRIISRIKPQWDVVCDHFQRIHLLISARIERLRTFAPI